MWICKKLLEHYYQYGFLGIIANIPLYFKLFLRRHIRLNSRDVSFSYIYDQLIDEHIIERKVTEYKEKGLRISFYVHLIRSLGDIIACEPVPRFLKSLVPDAKVYWILYGKYKSVLQYNPFVDEIIEVQSLSESSDLINSIENEIGKIVVDLHLDGLQCTSTGRFHRNLVNPSVNMSNYLQYGGLLESFSLAAGLPKLNDRPRFHFSPQVSIPTGLPDKYIVFHCKSAMPVKDWPVRKWNNLAQKLIKHGYKIVEIGEKNIISSRSESYFDCTTEHNLQKIAKIVEKAQLFVGIDSAFAHLANCFDKKAVLIIGILPIAKKYHLYSNDFEKNTNTIKLSVSERSARFVKVADVISAIEKIY